MLCTMLKKMCLQSYRKKQNGAGWWTSSYFFTQVNLTWWIIVVVHLPEVLLKSFSWLELCFFFSGGLSSADWSVRRLGGGGSMMPTTDGTAAAPSTIPSPDVTLNGRQNKLLENRDLCRIVGSYIPKPLPSVLSWWYEGGDDYYWYAASCCPWTSIKLQEEEGQRTSAMYYIL